jgi:hypothetical protein
MAPDPFQDSYRAASPRPSTDSYRPSGARRDTAPLRSGGVGMSIAEALQDVVTIKPSRSKPARAMTSTGCVLFQLLVEYVFKVAGLMSMMLREFDE